MSDNASPIEGQSTIVPDATATKVNQCVTQNGQEKNKLKQCPAQDDIVLQDRKCPKMKSFHMQSQEPKSYVLQSSKTSNQVQEIAPTGSKYYVATQASYNG